MGARVGRMFRNFNIENRAYRELAKEKPRVAPRHPVNLPTEVEDVVNQKSDPLLERLQSVYVESKDPAVAAVEDTKAVTTAVKAYRRPVKIDYPGKVFGLVKVTDVPKGKLTIAEAVNALGNHKYDPQTWTPENVAQEYSLDLKETKALLEFFIPFKFKVITPKSRTDKQIEAS
ncbi:NADH dehydrogenase [ubiquinone] 1 alpha subcomplex assembly factor 4 [Stegastes partitus]|uniref:NADH dehydrogenase [ubiquinone] 1 alpha subcomplex assembly factor 4 n=1 Tax=Stegastes partitus TaxID=144197 RepID=A0A3B4ZP21_9TELE|nr:PREDICTED: NADH dehydrogenase [ubiquinone] 1 alpha subcomplex assembly factor 4 [Stegastes partitus]